MDLIERRWTPFAMGLVLHHHCTLEPHPRAQAPIYPSVIAQLVEEGVLTLFEGEWRTTPLGAALVEMWCTTPLPVMKFVDPRFAALPSEDKHG